MRDPLAIGFVLSNLEVGGLQQAVYLTAKHLDPRRARAEVVALRPPNDRSTVMHDRLTAAGITVHELGLGRRADRSVRGALVAATRLRKLIRARGYDVVDSATLEADLVSRLAARGRCRQVTHLINQSYGALRSRPELLRARWRPRAAQLVDRLTARWSAHFVAISGAVAEEWRGALGIADERISVVRRGVESATFAPPAAAARQRHRLLAVGRLTEAKGHATAISAVRVLRGRGRPVELTIAGDGPLVADLRELAIREGVADHVTLVPSTARPNELYDTHGTFVFPSRWEGLGNALLEAMSSGLLCAVSDIPVFHEVLGDLGRYADVGDPVALADAVEQLLLLPDAAAAQLSAELVGRARSTFDIQVVTDDLTAVYDAVVGRG